LSSNQRKSNESNEAEAEEAEDIEVLEPVNSSRRDGTHSLLSFSKTSIPLSHKSAQKMMMKDAMCCSHGNGPECEECMRTTVQPKVVDKATTHAKTTTRTNIENVDGMFFLGQRLIVGICTSKYASCEAGEGLEVIYTESHWSQPQHTTHTLSLAYDMPSLIR
jgi:hypothetical protein